MSESVFCTILKNSFIVQGHYLYKIPDPTGDFVFTIKRPFDLIGRYNTNAIYIEMKYSSSLQSFNLNRIDEHQYESLLEFKKIQNAICLIGLGVNVSSKDKRIYLWGVEEVYKRHIEKKNYLKKELEQIPFYTVKKQLIQEPIILSY